MRIVKISLTVTVTTLIALAALAFISSRSKPQWPHFPDQKVGSPSVPQLLVEYDEPYDFGYRTGNLIPLKLLVKVPAECSIEDDTIAVNGDLQLVEKRVFSQRSADGTKYFRFDLKLRSFVYTPKLSAKAALSYHINGSTDIKLLESEVIEIYPSKTFDGRKMGHPKDPVLEPAQGYHGLVTCSMLLVGFAGMFCSSLTLHRRKRNSRKESANAIAPTETVRNPWTDANAAFDKVLAGNTNNESLQDLIRCLRCAYKIPTASYGHLQENFDEHPWNQALGVVLQILEDACIWGQRTLTPDDLENLRFQRSLLIGLSK